MESIRAKLEKSQQKLQSFTEAKNRLERNIEYNFQEIESLNTHIEVVEAQIERLVQDAAARDCRERTRRELALIKAKPAASIKKEGGGRYFDGRLKK